MPTVEIALATYNSSQYLREQLDSLFAQTWQDFTILAADDGSADSTLNILADYAGRHPGRIRMVAFGEPAGGPTANFSRLLEQLVADYAMFCDHDDVWKPDKIAVSLEKMRELELAHGLDVPLLVHTDLVVAKADLVPIHSSFWRYSGINPARNALPQLLLMNTVTGCTILMNRALYEVARPIPPTAIAHDYWCALVAATFGKIGYLDRGCISYRQHGRNVIGARAWNPPNILKSARNLFKTKEFPHHLVEKMSQARALLARYETVISEEQKKTIDALVNVRVRSRRKRFWALARYGLVMEGFLRNLALFLQVTR